MIVSEFMQKPFAVIQSTSSVRDALLLFIRSDETVLAVLKGDELYGSLRQAHILKALFPTQEQFMDSRFRNSFEEFESNIEILSNSKVKDICYTDIEKFIVRPDTDINVVLKKMYLHEVSHLPVVVEKKLIGAIHQRDILNKIFNSVDTTPGTKAYHDWSSQYHDLVHLRTPHLEGEISLLQETFTKQHVKTVLDIGFGTAKHAIALAEAGYHVVGIESSRTPYLSALKKRNSLPPLVKERLQFVYTENINEFLQKSPCTFDAIICLGNILALYPDWKDILMNSQKALVKNGILITQTANLYSYIHKHNGLIKSSITPSILTKDRYFSITSFFDKPQLASLDVTLVMSTLRFDGRIWGLEGINQTKITDIKEKDLSSIFDTFPGNFENFGHTTSNPCMKDAFDVQKHDVLLCVYKNK